MPKVYSYLRFSDPRQAEGASSERQAAYAADWAQQHGLELDESLTMRDEGLSAYHQRHITKGALGVFLAAVEAGQVPPGSVLVVEGLDRLSRAEPLRAQAQLTSIITAGVSVVTASDGKVYSQERMKAQPMDLVYSLLVMIRAHEESDTKSRRVRDAIRRQCLAWRAGTYRGLLRYGNTPGWLRVAGGRWEVIPERAAAVHLAIDLFRRGFGAGQVALRLHEAGLSTSSATPTSGHLVRLLASTALKGVKQLELDGEVHELEGYYPALLSVDEWDELQQLTARRGRQAVRSEIPSLLTGMGITFCGYCGSPLKAQTMTSKRRSDGTLSDGHRRLQCVRNNSGQRCSVPGSCSAAPIERALVSYCSDLVNLQSLAQGDAAAVPHAELAKAQAALEVVDGQLARLTDALLQDGGDAPATFVRRARDLEVQRAELNASVVAAQQALAAASMADVAGVDERWRALAEGIEGLDVEARLQGRRLVADAFARIVVYRRGVRPDENAAGELDVQLLAKSGVSRLLRVDRAGRWLAAVEAGPGLTR